MSNLRIVILVLCMCVGIIWLSGCDASEPEASDSHVGKVDVTGLKSEDMKERERAAELIRNDRSNLINKLIELAAEDVETVPSSDPRFVEYPWHDSKHLSILLLGDLRASEAVSTLIDNIEYRNPRTLWNDAVLSIGGRYPAVEALWKIGVTAIGPTIDKLSDYETKSRGREHCCWILKQILGVKLARLRLEIAIEETQDPIVKKNLTAALPYFKTQQEKAAEERARRNKTGG